jgi:hypothetical protein
MSALPPKADMVPHDRDVRFVPKADSCSVAPSPHGFARAEDYLGYENNITFWIEDCAVRYTPASCCYVRFGSKPDIAVISALPAKADTVHDSGVRFVPKADISGSICIASLPCIRAQREAKHGD